MGPLTTNAAEAALRPGENAWGERLDPLSRFGDILSPSQVYLATWAFVALGVAARLVRYFLCPPIWGDEAFLAVNFIDRGYTDLIGPLDYGQVCPLLFLWIELTVVKLFSFNEFSLRLFPLVCGLGSLFVFRHLARRLLSGLTCLLAVGLFSVSYPGIRYAVETKPYGTDLFVALLLITLAVEWGRRPERNRWLWALVAAVPFAVGLSYPAVFIAGGISVCIALILWTTQTRSGWLPWAGYNMALVGSFVALFAISAGAQSAADLAGMRMCWSEGFPPLAEPIKLIGWTVVAHTSEMLTYPIGGAHGGSTLTAICCGAALFWLWRNRRYRLLVLCLTPFALNFVAAALARYPYGVRIRFMLYLAPIVCTLAGLGAAVLLAWLFQWRVSIRRAAIVSVLGFFALVAVGSMARDVWRPYRTRDFLRARAFARWFWFNKAYDAELVCLKTDLKKDFSPTTWRAHYSAVYLCNQHIYSPRHAAGKPPEWNHVSRERPLRCVQFKSDNFEFDEKAFACWLDEMKTRYDLVGHEKHRFPVHYKDRELQYNDWIEVYEFVPKRDVASKEPADTKEAAKVRR